MSKLNFSKLKVKNDIQMKKIKILKLKKISITSQNKGNV